MPKYISVQIRLTEEQHALIKASASKHDVSVTGLVSQAAAKLAEKMGGTPPKPRKCPHEASKRARINMLRECEVQALWEYARVLGTNDLDAAARCALVEGLKAWGKMPEDYYGEAPIVD